MAVVFPKGESMMLANKLRWVFLGVLLLAFSGCGEKENGVAAAAPAVASVERAADRGVAEEGGEDEDDEDEDGSAEGPFSREKFLQEWTKGCVESVSLFQQGAKPEPAKL
jgi:hypothetical protein